MNKIRKICNNILSLRALSVLGYKNYVFYIFNAVLALPAILKIGDLRALDQRMGRRVKRFKFRGQSVTVDCNYCDTNSNENTYTFGLVRELLIRDCYFRWHEPDVYTNARTVVDLGANRGVFSMLMTPRANFILSVDYSATYMDFIKDNYKANNFSNYSVQNTFIGEGGVCGEGGRP